MRLTIIPADKTVYVDGLPYGDIDMSWIPEINEKSIHAVQWLDDGETGEGEIEFVGNHQNLKITSLDIEGICSFKKSIEQWNEKKEEYEFLLQQRLEEEERLRKEQEELMQTQFLEFNKTHIPSSEEVDEDDGDLFYDIEELLKEI
jgi:hypothetical protein